MPTIRRVPQDYATVVLAHTAAESGDIIYLSSQVTLTSTFVVTKAVHLIGAGELTDTVFSLSTAFGLFSNSSAFGTLRYNLSAVEAAKVPFLLVENIAISNTDGNFVSGVMGIVELYGSVPTHGIVFNRCLINRNAGNPFYIQSTGWKIELNRSLTTRSSINAYTGLASYGSPINSGQIIKSRLPVALTSADLAQNWETKDLVTTATTGYGPVPVDGIVLRMDELDATNYRIYGTVTDIPNFVLPSHFHIRLYQELTPQGNDVGNVALETRQLTLVTQGATSWSGSWEFAMLLPTRRYGVLINPPDGMQGHWLRWYNPAVE